jgi:hypothetical protein
MGFLSNLLKKGTINTCTLRVLKDLGESLESYRKLNPSEPLDVILNDNRFFKTLKVRNLIGTVERNADNLIPPCPQDLIAEHPDQKLLLLVVNIVKHIVIYELSYDKTIGSYADFGVILNIIINNIDKYIAL